MQQDNKKLQMIKANKKKIIHIRIIPEFVGCLSCAPTKVLTVGPEPVLVILVEAEALLRQELPAEMGSSQFVI